MATLILSAVGTAIGGPLGGTIGSLIGSQIDRAIIGSPRREGPRLKELAVTTSSYGSPLARHFGTMRAPGSIVWATDLVETSEKTGGGKGRPSTTTFNYSASLAVALASRPIRRLGRVWADGNLLRGAAEDLKTGGELRIYLGHGEHRDAAQDVERLDPRGSGNRRNRRLPSCGIVHLPLPPKRTDAIPLPPSPGWPGAASGGVSPLTQGWQSAEPSRGARAFVQAPCNGEEPR